MERKILESFNLFILALVCCGQATANEALLPFGQFTQKPWTARCFHSTSGESPSDDWFSIDFDDSDWATIEGPISTNGGIEYRATTWDENYTTYWVRRHFKINDINEYPFKYLFVYHDDGCEIYLNGALIYNDEKYHPNLVTITMTEEMCSHFVEGDNVIAVRVSDTGGGEAFMDFGIEASHIRNLTNSGFEDGRTGWDGSYDCHTRDGNTIGYRYGRTFNCQQALQDVPTGLYCLSANACGVEYYYDYNTAWSHRNDEIPAKLFINKDELSIPSAFSEMADYDYGWCWNIDGKFVPYYVDGTPTAFKNGMYLCEVWSFYEPDSTNTMTIGIHSEAPNDINRWAAWDNLRLIYYTEKEVITMLDSIVNLAEELNKKHQNKEIREQANKMTTIAASAKDYADKAHAYLGIKQFEITVRKSIEMYEKLDVTRQILAKELEDCSEFTSPATIEEATLLNQEILSAYENGVFSNEDVSNAIEKMNKMITRLGYTYLDIAVNIPGAMGDSILSKVENFVDVQSLRVSGTLNDADLSTIQSRLSQLREIDMTDVKMTILPNRFFYQHSLLEIVKLPSALTSVGEYAFYQCYGLKHMDFPSTLTAINRYAFSECDNLQEVILPEGLTTLGECAFYSCDNNKYVKLPSSLTYLSSYAFYYNISLKTIDFTEGLTHIYDCAFYECYALNNLKFPTSLYYIGGNAFAYNRSLSNIDFNEGLFQIADNAFYDCDALTEVTLPSSLVLAYASPFDYCDNLKKVTCLSIEPPYMTDQIPYGLGMDGRELYVPALSINTYKQTAGWDKFQTIKPIDYLPENITVLGNLKLTLPETIPAEYKPNVSIIHDQKGTSYLQYGSLTVNGEGTLSISDFSLVWDPNYQYNYNTRTQNYCTLVNNSHLRADNVYIRFYTHNDRWTFFTLPFDVRVSDIETICEGTTNWIIRKYDGQKRASGETSETWIKLTGDDILKAGEGYIIQGSRYVGSNWQDYSGFRMKAIKNANKNDIFQTSDIIVNLNEYESEFAHNRSWNFIGNPYPSYYDARFMDFEAPITVWNVRNNTYEAYSPSDDSYILCPGEAFFVQRPIAIGNIVFSKDGRQTNRDVRTLESNARTKRSEGNKATRTIINLSVSDGNHTDRTRIVLNDKATLLYEMDKDASKFMSTDATVPQIYTSVNGVNYAINERPFADGIVNLITYFGSEGLYTITLANEVSDYNVILEDKVENKSVTLTPGSGYTFSTQAGTYANRFVLHFVNETTGIEEHNSEIQDNDAILTTDGIRVLAPTKGIYIQNGKKVLLNK